MNSELTRPLAFAGALPFVTCALLLIAGHRELPMFGSIERITASYGLLILAFMAGTHWGQYLQGVRTSFSLLISSNAFALAAWIAYLLLSPKLFFASLAALFAILLMIDRKLSSQGVLPADYALTRTMVSALVVISLAIIALKM